MLVKGEGVGHGVRGFGSRVRVRGEIGGRDGTINSVRTFGLRRGRSGELLMGGVVRQQRFGVLGRQRRGMGMGRWRWIYRIRGRRLSLQLGARLLLAVR